MKIAVIGSTKGTGLEVVKQGIERGHAITALARHPENLADINGIHSIITGDALNSADVRKAVAGQDAVISVLGISGATRNVIPTMVESNVKRGIWVSAWPIVATRPWFMVKLTWLLFGKHYRELAKTEQLISKSDLDWTIVRPPRLTNGALSGKVRVLKSDNLPSGPYSLSRADLAKVLLDEAESTSDIRSGLVVTTMPKSSKKVSQGISAKTTTN